MYFKVDSAFVQPTYGEIVYILRGFHEIVIDYDKSKL